MAKAKAKPAEQPCGFCAYIGPTIAGLTVHGTLYQGAKDTVLTTDLRRACEAYPDIRNLVVPGNTLADGQKSIKTPGSALHTQYQLLLRAINKKEENKK